MQRLDVSAELHSDVQLTGIGNRRHLTVVGEYAT